MCGIVGYVGKQSASPILVEGLKRLEYRGYDSAGLALMEGDRLELFKKTGRVEVVGALVAKAKPSAKLGISHTRWATHGGVTDQNAHPHVSADGKLALVHNGVIENYASLKRELSAKGIEFQSETDTEALTNLVAYLYKLALNEGAERSTSTLLTALRAALTQVEGTYGIAMICTDFPDQIFGARKGSPLVVGIGRKENFIASDIAAFAGRTQDVIYLRDNEVVHLNAETFTVTTIADAEVAPVISHIDWEVESAELGSFKHYMLKEIFEQPTALENAMRGRFALDGSTAQFGGLNLDARELRQVDRILFLGCGTAWHACLVAEYLIEKYARIPVEVEYASEFRYRNAPMFRNTLVFVVSQSGETIDTLEAQREAKRKGFRVLGITNVVSSTIARENDGGIYQHSGPEIGVASTKAFISQIHIAGMLALYLGRMRDMSFSEGVEIVKALQTVPGLVAQTLQLAEQIEIIAHKYKDYEDFLFLGRQLMFPIALEGALKLKEISYIHAEGYPAAEMKHGPIALISPKCPTLAFAHKGEIFKKSLSNIQEIKARKGPVIAITNAGKEFPEGLADDVIHIPESHEIISATLSVIPVQLLSYYIAVLRGCDVDKPRNLAKSVTVE